MPSWLEYVLTWVLAFLFVILFSIAYAASPLLPGFLSRLITSSNARQAYILEVFPILVDQGIMFTALGELCLVGIGLGTQYLEDDPATLYKIGSLLTLGFLSFFFARMLASGPLFHFLTFVGVSACMAIMGTITFHFAFPTFELLPIVVAPIFTFILLVSHHIKRFMVTYGIIKNPNFGTNVYCPSHHECLEYVLKIGLQLAVFFGTGLLVVVTWANLQDKYPNIQAMAAIYTGASFWLFYGAKLLGKGMIFEVFVWAGAVMELSMFVTSTLYVLLPVWVYDLPILLLSALLVTSTLEWCRVLLYIEDLNEEEAEGFRMYQH